MPVRSSQLPKIAFCAYAASTLIAQAVMSLGAALLGLALLIDLGGPRGVALAFREAWSTAPGRRYSIASLALWGALMLSLAVACWAPLGWGGRVLHAGFVEHLGKSWYFAWPILLAAGLRRLDERGRAAVLRTWLITLGAVSAVGVVQYFTGWPRAQAIPGNDGRFHATLFLGHHLSAASILIFPFFAALDALKRALGGGAALPARAALGCALLGFAALFLGYSRMLWAALPLGLLIWAARALPRRKAVLAGLLLVAGGAALTQVPAVHRRLQDTVGSSPMGVTERQKLWAANFEFLRLRPLTGTGYRLNNEASGLYLESISGGAPVFTGHAHNNLIDMLGGTGLIGAAAWLAWCWVGLWLLRLALRRDATRAQGFAWGLACAWIVFHVNGLTQVNFWEGKVLHQMMWVTAWALMWATEEVQA